MLWDSEYKELIVNVKKQAGVSQAKLSHIWDVWTISAYWSRLKISLLSHSDQHLSFLFLSNAALALTKVGLSWLYYRKIHPTILQHDRQGNISKTKDYTLYQGRFQKKPKNSRTPYLFGTFHKIFWKSRHSKIYPTEPYLQATFKSRFQNSGHFDHLAQNLG